MSDKIQKEFKRNEFAQYLETLAEQMRAGKISTTKGDWAVPEGFGAKVELKEKKGRIELKINSRWSTLAEYSEQDREKIVDWHDQVDKKCENQYSGNNTHESNTAINLILHRQD